MMRASEQTHRAAKRVTRQSTAVYEAVVQDASHPSAEVIYRRVRQALPHISLGTVYRNLRRLAADGKIRVLSLGERTTRYDAVAVEHDHFICRQCGQVLDLRLQREHHVDITPLMEQGFFVVTQSILLHGICQRCRVSSQAAEPQGLTVAEAGHGQA